jgi:hypothetical protein
MIEVKNQFAAHGIFWLLSLPFVALLSLPALMSASSFVVSPQEVSFFSHVLMRDVKAIEHLADSWFKLLFEDTHITTMVRDFFNPAKTSGITPLASKTISLGQNYNNGVWLMAYRGLYRIAGLWPVVLAVFLSLGVPCLFDGLAVRARKAYNFQFHNPVFFWSAGHLLILIMGLGVFLPFMPIALSSTILASFFGLFCGAIWITAANFQTGN